MALIKIGFYLLQMRTRPLYIESLILTNSIEIELSHN